MSKPRIDVIFILDRSGSMASLGTAPATGFNEFVQNLRQNKSVKYRLTLIQFDDRYEVNCTNAKLKNVPKLVLGENYMPRNSTALYDALGRAVSANIAKKNVLVAVFTDGQENASNEYTRAAVEKLIKHQTKKGWDFNFLSSDLKAVEDAVSHLGFLSTRTFKVTNDSAGMQHAYYTAATVADNYAQTILDQNLTASQKDLTSSIGGGSSNIKLPVTSDTSTSTVTGNA